MNREMIQGLAQLQELFNKGKDLNLNDLVWEILGGYPLKYKELSKLVIDADDPGKVFEDFLMRELVDAHFIIQKELRANPDLQYGFNTIEGQHSPAVDDMRYYKVVRSSPDKLFFKYEREMYPSNAAIAFVIKHDLYKMPELPSFAEIKAVADAQRKIDKKQGTEQIQAKQK